MGVIQQTVNTWGSDIRARQKASRNTTIIRLSRLGWPQEKISETVELSQNRVSKIIGNTNFSKIDTLLSQSRDMDYIVLDRKPRFFGQKFEIRAKLPEGINTKSETMTKIKMPK